MKCLDQLCNNTALDLSNFCASHSRDTKTSPQHYKNIANDNVRLFKELQRVQEERDLTIDENWKIRDEVAELKEKLEELQLNRDSLQTAYSQLLERFSWARSRLEKYEPYSCLWEGFVYSKLRGDQ